MLLAAAPARLRAGAAASKARKPVPDLSQITDRRLNSGPRVDAVVSCRPPFLINAYPYAPPQNLVSDNNYTFIMSYLKYYNK